MQEPEFIKFQKGKPGNKILQLEVQAEDTEDNLKLVGVDHVPDRWFPNLAQLENFYILHMLENNCLTEELEKESTPKQIAFSIERASNAIAKASRLARGNHLILNEKTLQFMGSSLLNIRTIHINELVPTNTVICIYMGKADSQAGAIWTTKDNTLSVDPKEMSFGLFYSNSTNFTSVVKF